MSRPPQVLKVAEEELEFLTGCSGIPQGSAALRERFPNLRLLLVTRGGKGSIALWQDVTVECPAYLQPNTVDTTGAGDNFAAGFIDALLRGEGLVDCARWGNAVASLCVERVGATTGPRERDEIARRAKALAARSA